jgi:hypothetical protein
VAASGIGGTVFVEGPEVAVRIDASRTHIQKPVGWGARALKNGLGIDKVAAGSVGDHVKTAT